MTEPTTSSSNPYFEEGMRLLQEGFKEYNQLNSQTFANNHNKGSAKAHIRKSRKYIERYCPMKGVMVVLAPSDLEHGPIRTLREKVDKIVLIGHDPDTLKKAIPLEEGLEKSSKITSLTLDLSGGFTAAIAPIAGRILLDKAYKAEEVRKDLVRIMSEFEPKADASLGKLKCDYLVSSLLATQLSELTLDRLFLIFKKHHSSKKDLEGSLEFDLLQKQMRDKMFTFHLSCIRQILNSKASAYFADTIAQDREDEGPVQLITRPVFKQMESMFTVKALGKMGRGWKWQRFQVDAFHLVKPDKEPTDEKQTPPIK